MDEEEEDGELRFFDASDWEKRTYSRHLHVEQDDVKLPSSLFGGMRALYHIKSLLTVVGD